MSGLPIHTPPIHTPPIHTLSARPIHTQTFTSTLHDGTESSINVWIILLTAIFFFVILSWYNFALSLYNYFIGFNPNDVEDFNQQNYHNVVVTLGFAGVWTIVSIISLFLLKYYGMLGSSMPSLSEEHPLLRNEGKSIGDSSVLGPV